MSSPLKLQNFMPFATQSRAHNGDGKILANDYGVAQGGNQETGHDQSMDASQLFEEIVKQTATPKTNISDTLNSTDDTVRTKFDFKGLNSEKLDTSNSSAQVTDTNANTQKNSNDNLIDTKRIWQNTNSLKLTLETLQNQTTSVEKIRNNQDTLAIPEQRTSLDLIIKSDDMKDIFKIKKIVQAEQTLQSFYDSAQNKISTSVKKLDVSDDLLSSQQGMNMDANTAKNSFDEIAIDKNLWEKLQALPNLQNKQPITLEANSVLPCLDENLKIIFQPLEKLESADKNLEIEGNKILLKQKIPVLQKQVNHQPQTHQADSLFFAKSSNFNAKHAINFQFQIPYDKGNNQNISSENLNDNQGTKISQTSVATPKQQNSFSFGLSSPNLGEVMVHIKKIANDYKLTFLCSKNSTAITLGKNMSILDSQLSSKGIAVSSFGIVGVESNCMKQVGYYNASMNLMMPKKYLKTK